MQAALGTMFGGMAVVMGNDCGLYWVFEAADIMHVKGMSISASM